MDANLNTQNFLRAARRQRWTLYTQNPGRTSPRLVLNFKPESDDLSPSLSRAYFNLRKLAKPYNLTITPLATDWAGMRVLVHSKFDR